MREDDIITWPTFRVLILKSCLQDELVARLMSKPEKNWNFSVFQERPTLELDAKALSKRGGAKNFQSFRQAKHVRWTGLPTLEEEESKTRTRKVMKDAPKGAELQNNEEGIEEANT